MPQPTLNQVHVNAALTDISVAYVQDSTHFIADKVFPMVPVVHKADVYYTFNQGDFYRDDVQQVADASESAGGGFNLTTASYACKMYGYHKDVGDQVRANQDPAVDIDVTTTKWLMQKQLIRRDNIFNNLFMTTGLWTGGVSNTDAVGTAGGMPGTTTPPKWSDDGAGDPITDIAIAQQSILQNTGFLPNKLVLGFPVYNALKKHPLVIDRLKYTMQADSRDINEQLLASLFDVDQVLVSKSVYNTASEGLTNSFSFTMGNNALLCHSTPTPGLMVPTAGYIFPWEGLTGLNSMGIVVWQDRIPGKGRNTIRTDSLMSFDMQVVAAGMGAFFSGMV